MNGEPLVNSSHSDHGNALVTLQKDDVIVAVGQLLFLGDGLRGGIFRRLALPGRRRGLAVLNHLYVVVTVASCGAQNT